MRRQRDADGKQAAQPREVNSLLHTLRGEQFRHSQNLRRSRTHLKALGSRTYNDPSLPFSDIYKYAHAPSDDSTRDEDRPPPPLPVIREGHLEHGYPRGAVPGPPPPRSWSGLFRHHDREHDAEDRDTVAFRRRALSLVFSHTPWSFGSGDVPRLRSGDGGYSSDDEPAVPPLTQLCLRVLLAAFPDAAEFRDELLEVLPPMFRRDLLRYTAVHGPLPNGKLYALFEPEGHVDGEVIVVGPQATLQRDLFVSSSPHSASHRDGGDEEAEDRQNGPSGSGQAQSSLFGPDTEGAEAEAEAEAETGEEEADDWEAESSSSQELPPPLQTLIVLNAQVPSATLFLLPLTLTRLALLALPVPSPQVHRLPRICPLLEVLDLSYNPWLNDPPGGKGHANVESTLDRIEWEKWARLQVLGLRMCNVPESIIARVNKGRLGDEVEIVGLDERTFGGSLDVVEGMMSGLRLSD
ncbi:hypothetical protein BD310DRAFT_804092 [Dichomitus squalens]|uniref:Uncharacterized protein n=1 Tax=Dichomitus squalens TaxID=114155 RepID=A0A4Q9QDF9_9APHY|nr:hypothetical protein BD310DRAFT_804092 [Dichomitus squalens]